MAQRADLQGDNPLRFGATDPFAGSLAVAKLLSIRHCRQRSFDFLNLGTR